MFKLQAVVTVSFIGNCRGTIFQAQHLSLLAPTTESLPLDITAARKLGNFNGDLYADVLERHQHYLRYYHIRTGDNNFRWLPHNHHKVLDLYGVEAD